MVNWIGKEPEYDNWPTGTNYFNNEEEVKFEKLDSCVVQPEEDENKPRPKPDVSRDMYFYCLKESYPDNMEI